MRGLDCTAATQVAHLVRRAAARRADRRAGREGSRPPGPDQGALARAPTRPAPSALPRSAFAVPARTALRACAPLAILTVPACSLGRRVTAETASAADAGPGGRGCTRARESSRLVLLRRLGGVRGRRRSRVARRRRHIAAAVCVCVCACVCHLSEVFLMPNTHTGPGAGRWEGGGARAGAFRPPPSGRYKYNLVICTVTARAKRAGGRRPPATVTF